MGEVFTFKEWNEMAKELLGGLRLLLGLYARSGAENVKIHMKPYINKAVSDYYDSVCLGALAVENIERYGDRGERFIRDIKRDIEKASAATAKELLYGVDSAENIFDFNNLINELSQILRKRKDNFEEMLGSFSGQMLRYMLLWDCEDYGLTRYRFMTVGESCDACKSLDGKIFDIKDAQSGINLAPMHPNCDCTTHILDDNLNVVMTVGGKENEDFGAAEYDGYFAPFLRIPKDAWEMFKAYCAAQNERAQNIKGPLTFLDWVTMGIVSSWWKSEGERADAAFSDPSFYNIGNWVTTGLFDTIKGAINPDEPYSLEHILNSAALAGTVVGAVKVGQSTEIPKKPVSYKKIQAKNEPIYSAAGDAGLRASRRNFYDELYKNGFRVNGIHYTLNEHAYNSLFKSGRKDIMPADIYDALKGRCLPGQPGSVKYINEVTGTKVFVNSHTNEIVGIWPANFKE